MVLSIVLIFVSAWTVVLCITVPARAAERPAYCASIPDALLSGLAEPYGRKVAPDGSVYCEGILRTPISLPPPEIISAKQDQATSPFVRDSIAVLTWCDEASSPARVSLRSVKEPLFSLDALQATKFEWRADLIAAWQPNWDHLAALVTRQVPLEGRNQEVVIPVRIGSGYSNQYSFIVRSKRPVRFTRALIEATNAAANSEIIDLTTNSGPTKNTWAVSISFGSRIKGLYRITLQEPIDQAGASTKPIYLVHSDCADK
jgi:hypothetical protein